MSATVEGKAKRKRRSRLPAGPAGARLVRDELLRRGFDAQLADRYTKKYDALVGRGPPPKRAHLRTVHVVHGMFAVRILLEPLHIKSRSMSSLASKEIRIRSFLRDQEQRHGDQVPSAPGLARIWIH